MRKGSAAEWMLERAAGDVRGVAIYGDLLELAATRGRVWFWMAYVRTLVALTWRTPAAFACGTVVFAAMFRLRPTLPRMWWLWWAGMHHPYLTRGTRYVALSLWFLLPFVATRYGLQDRFVRLAIAVGAMVTLAVLLPVLPLLLGGEWAGCADRRCGDLVEGVAWRRIDAGRHDGGFCVG